MEYRKGKSLDRKEVQWSIVDRRSSSFRDQGDREHHPFFLCSLKILTGVSNGLKIGITAL